MSSFKLNTKKITNSIEEYKHERRNLLDEINGIHESLKNVDAGWNDINSEAFMKTIKKNRIIINDYFDDMDVLYNKIEEFKNKIDYLCVKEGNKKNSSTLKINEEKVNLVLKKINKVITYLNNAMYYINKCNFRSDFEQIYKVYKLRSAITEIKKITNSVIDNISTFYKNSNKIINDYQIEMSKISNFDINLKPLEYLWKTQDVDYVTQKRNDISEYRIKSNNIRFNSKDNNVNAQNNYSSLVNNNISIKEQVRNDINTFETNILNNNMNIKQSNEENLIITQYNLNKNDLNIAQNEDINYKYTNYAPVNNIDINNQNNNINVINNYNGTIYSNINIKEK